MLKLIRARKHMKTITNTFCNNVENVLVVIGVDNRARNVLLTTIKIYARLPVVVRVFKSETSVEIRQALNTLWQPAQSDATTKLGVIFNKLIISFITLNDWMSNEVISNTVQEKHIKTYCERVTCLNKLLDDMMEYLASDSEDIETFYKYMLVCIEDNNVERMPMIS